MALAILPSFPLDPNGFTGPTRQMSGIVRMGAIIADTPYGEFARWLYVGVTGNVEVTCWDGTTQTMLSMASGVWHPVASINIVSAGTTATNLLWGS